MTRTPKDRLEAIQPAIARRDEFLARVEAADNARDLSALMIEAIDMHLEANGIEVVRKDGRALICMEEICASHCLKAVRDRYHVVS